MRIVGMAIGTLVAGIALAVFSVATLWPSPAEAATYNIAVTMTEAAAISTCDPNPAPANGGGTAMVSYDDATNLLEWDITFQNLSGAAIAAHFHGPATAGEDAGIQVTIGDLTSPSEGSATITETQEAQLLGGHWYINYHTDDCSGGEIRGQVSGSGVGGVAELPGVDTSAATTSAGSGSNAGLYAGLAATVAVASLVVAGGALYVTRRVTR